MLRTLSFDYSTDHTLVVCLVIWQRGAAMNGVDNGQNAKLALSGLSECDLNQYVGKDIKEICDTDYVDPRVNHCAHFVSHVIGLKVGLICGSMKYETRGQGASLRVNEIYNSCSSVGDWSSRPESVKHCFIFATLASNVSSRGVMGEHPKKHIGIFLGGNVWHYSNGGDKVVTDSPQSFLNKFKGVYGQTTETYYGVL